MKKLDDLIALLPEKPQQFEAAGRISKAIYSLHVSVGESGEIQILSDLPDRKSVCLVLKQCVLQIQKENG